MAKRGADNYMTDQNWDREEEEEKAGKFAQADESVLKTRQVKKAKRRGETEGDTSGIGTGGIFKGFAGFTKTAAPATAFGSLGSKPLAFSNGSSSTANSQELTKPSFSFKSTTETKTSTVKEESKSVGNDGAGTDKVTANCDFAKTPPSSRSKYLHQLKALNEGVTKWIKEHVDSNAYCVLTPIFRDYERYLAEIERKYPPTEEKLETKSQEQSAPEAGSGTKAGDASFAKVSPSSGSATPSGGSLLTLKPVETTTTTITTLTSPPVFKFGSAADTASAASTMPATTTSASVSTGLFSLSSAAVSTSATTGSTFSSGFSFGSGASSVFGSGATTSGFSFAASKLSENKPTTSAGTTEDEEYVPPKDEVKEVSEENAIYTKRCKLFFKKDDQWKEKGVGNLHLKPCGEKTQLLIRADTNLGNILLNIMLSATMPISRQGKNNVAIVCVPNPPLDPKDDPKAMVPMLIRVKNGEDADQLFEKLDENKR